MTALDEDGRGVTRLAMPAGCPRYAAPMSAALRHLHLASRDHAASLQFYATYFGLRFAATFPRGDAPAATILSAPDGFQLYLEGPSPEALPPWFHFGFLVASADACRELHARMQADGVSIARPFVTEPFASFFFTDPDGHLAQAYFDPRATM